MDSDIQKKAGKKASKIFIGLNWKISLLSSLILLLVVTIFSVINYQSLIDSIDQEREAKYRRYAREIESLIGRNSENLHGLVRIIPYLKDMEPSLLSGMADKVFDTFDRYWTLFQIQNDIEDVRFYDSSDSLLAKWGNFEANNYRDNLILDHIREVNLHEQPATLMICVESCTQYIIEPLLVESTRVGTIVIGSSLVDVFLNFKRASGSDIGLFVKNTLIPAHEGESFNNGSMSIPEWDVYIAAMTDSKKKFCYSEKSSHDLPRFENHRSRYSE